MVKAGNHYKEQDKIVISIHVDNVVHVIRPPLIPKVRLHDMLNWGRGGTEKLI